MMQKYSFYHKDTGAIHDAVFSTDDESQLFRNIPKDHVPIEGTHDPLNKRVDLSSLEVVDYVPPQPSLDHEWDTETKRWHLSAVKIAEAQRIDTVKGKIFALESSTMRLMRESMLGDLDSMKKLTDINDQIAALRKEL